MLDAVTLLSSLVASLTHPAQALLEALARTMILRDEDMHDHGHRVRLYALALASEAGITDDETTDALEAAALLHDIGKLGIPDRVLHKPGPLTPDEYDLVKRHAVIGADILSGIAFPGPLALIVRHHHENWDGTGYPDRLRGDEIPRASRVLAIADCYDALTSDRPYRRAMSPARAVAIIEQSRGTMYDPAIAEAFLRIIPSLHAVRPRERGAVIDVNTSAAWLPQARAV